MNVSTGAALLQAQQSTEPDGFSYIRVGGECLPERSGPDRSDYRRSHVSDATGEMLPATLLSEFGAITRIEDGLGHIPAGRDPPDLSLAEVQIRRLRYGWL
jgi:hypothetical protein